jgi:hypothetical protein
MGSPDLTISPEIRALIREYAQECVQRLPDESRTAMPDYFVLAAWCWDHHPWGRFRLAGSLLPYFVEWGTAFAAACAVRWPTALESSSQHRLGRG